MNKREQRPKFNSVQADSSKDADIDSSVQTANNTNIHFQTHNSIIARSFVGIYLNIKYILNIWFFKNTVQSIINAINTYLIH